MTTYSPYITIPTQVFTTPAASILLPVALGTAVGFSTRPTKTKTTYNSLRQPPLNPPAWVFGPVWTVLYGLMGYAAYRGTFTGLSPFSSPATLKTTRTAMTLYSVQLGLNLAWMPLFFSLNRPVIALADILALLGVNGYLTFLWYGIDNVAAYCQAPYLAWLSFATYLCAGAGYLNNWDVSSRDASESKDSKGTKGSSSRDSKSTRGSRSSKRRSRD